MKRRQTNKKKLKKTLKNINIKIVTRSGFEFITTFEASKICN